MAPFADIGSDLGILALFALGIGLLLALGKYYPGSGAQQLDWKPTRSFEDEIQLEMEDVDQMLEAKNERRRAQGKPDVTEDEVRADVEARLREQQERSRRYKADQSAEQDWPES